MEAATADNTGLRAWRAGIVLPSVSFPSDHALATATLRLRCPLSPLPAVAAGPGVSVAGSSDCGSVGDDHADVSASSRLRAEASAGGGERTLYDYWGLGSRPVAVRRLLEDRRPWLADALAQPALTDGGIAGGGGGAEAGVAGVCSRRFAQLARRARAEVKVDPDALDRYAGRGEQDGPVWILFNPRPFTTGMGQV